MKMIVFSPLLFVIIILTGSISHKSLAMDALARDKVGLEAARGDAYAQCQLGFRFLTGSYGVQDDLLAEEWFLKAARNNHPFAMVQLGKMYRRKGNLQDSIAYFKQAANQGELESLHELLVMARERGEILVEREYLEKLANSKFLTTQRNLSPMYCQDAKKLQLDALCALGAMYEAGSHHLMLDVETAKTLYKKALLLDSKYEPAVCALAALTLRKNPNKTEKEAIKKLLLSCENSDNCNLHCLLGDLFWGENNWLAAKEWYYRVRKKSPEACFKIAQLLEKNLIAENSHPYHFYYKKAAQKGHVQAIETLRRIAEESLLGFENNKQLMRKIPFIADCVCLLGYLYLKGIHVNKNIKLAIKYLTKAAHYGSWESIYLLETIRSGKALYALGKIMEAYDSNPAKHKLYISRLIGGGYFDAGEGKEKRDRLCFTSLENPEAAKKIFKMRIGEGECLLSEVNISLIEQAVYWYSTAALYKHPKAVAALERLAKQGAAGALYSLGMFYDKGVCGKEKDSAKATQLYAQSAALYHPAALRALANGSLQNPAGEFALGQLYRRGMGIPKDNYRAAERLRKAAEGGHEQALQELKNMAEEETIADAAFSLALFYLNSSKHAECLEWYKRAADMGKAYAAFLAAGYYTCNLAGPANLSMAIHWYKRAVHLGDDEGLEKLLELAETNSEAMLGIGQLYAEPGRLHNIPKAIEWYTKALAAGHPGGFYHLAVLYENMPADRFVNSQQIIDLLQEVLRLYTRAAQQHYLDAALQVKRVQRVLTNSEHLRSNFANSLFGKLKAEIAGCTPEFLLWTGVITENACNHEEVVQIMVIKALITISKCNCKGQFARSILKHLLELVRPGQFIYAFREGRVGQLVKFCHGVNLLEESEREFPRDLRYQFRRADDCLMDMRIQVYNSYLKDFFHIDDVKEFAEAGNKLLELFSALQAEGAITNQMLYDSKRQMCGSHDSLFELFCAMKTDREKGRFVKIADHVLGRLDRATQAAQLATWAIAGLYCGTRAEIEMSKYCLYTFTDAATLDKENQSLDMRIALCLSEFRKSCISRLVPINASERIHQVAYLEKKVWQVLALIGDLDGFSDQFQSIVVDEAYKRMTPQNICDEVLKSYKVSDMVNCILSEANKRNGSRIPVIRVLDYLCDYFRKKLTRSQHREITDELRVVIKQRAQESAMESLNTIYDQETGLMTEIGAKLLLHHFGYLD